MSLALQSRQTHSHRVWLGGRHYNCQPDEESKAEAKDAIRDDIQEKPLAWLARQSEARMLHWWEHGDWRASAVHRTTLSTGWEEKVTFSAASAKKFVG